MFDLDLEINSALDPTPETPMTPLDDLQVLLTGLTAFSTPAFLVMMARLVPGMLPGAVALLCGGGLGLVFYGATRGHAAKVKSIVYGLAVAVGSLAGGWDYLWMITQNAGTLGNAALIGAALLSGLLLCFFLKGVVSNAE